MQVRSRVHRQCSASSLLRDELVSRREKDARRSARRSQGEKIHQSIASARCRSCGAGRRCFVSGAGTAAAATRWVNDDGVAVPPGNSCNNPGYSTVQAAVNAAASGDRINVCPGTYREEVLIPAGKNNLQLRSVQFWAAVIKAPALMLGPTKSIVRVSGARGVTILAFTITGPGGFACDSLRYGVGSTMAGRPISSATTSPEFTTRHSADVRTASPSSSAGRLN